MLDNATMKEKSDQTLRERIRDLRRAGIEPGLQQETKTVDKLVKLIGDLTLYEIHRLVEIAVKDHNATILADGDDSPDFGIVSVEDTATH
jgi:hypothetical protein